MDALGRYTARHMLEAADEYGLPASPRLLREWVQLGLLDRPEVRGRGRAFGVRGTYSSNQRQLFVALLQLRERKARRAQLAKIPVWLWLRWGDEYAPLRQVRRALETWEIGIRSASWSKTDARAAQLATAVSAPGARQHKKRWFRTVLSDIATDAAYDRSEFISAGREIMDPDRTNSFRGPVDASLGPEQYADLIDARLEAISRLSEFSDEEFSEARDFYRYARADYAQRYGGFHLDPDIGRIFEAPTDNREIDSACLRLVEILGLLSGARVDRR